jgi:hypothetical protein
LNLLALAARLAYLTLVTFDFFGRSGFAARAAVFLRGMKDDPGAPG